METTAPKIVIGIIAVGSVAIAYGVFGFQVDQLFSLSSLLRGIGA